MFIQQQQQTGADQIMNKYNKNEHIMNYIQTMQLFDFIFNLLESV